MYNRLFTKILDSSIWMEKPATRVVWITFLAAMDEDGFVQLSSIQNVALRANLPLKATEEAIRVLESPDTISPGQEYEGRRIERVPYGWMVLNAAKHHESLNRAKVREQTRLRVQRHRAKQEPLLEEESESNTDSYSYSEVTVGNSDVTRQALQVYSAYPRKVGKAAAIRAIIKAIKSHGFSELLDKTKRYAACRDGEDEQFTPHPATWFNRESYLEDESVWRPKNGKPKQSDFLGEVRKLMVGNADPQS